MGRQENITDISWEPPASSVSDVAAAATNQPDSSFANHRRQHSSSELLSKKLSTSLEKLHSIMTSRSELNKSQSRLDAIGLGKSPTTSQPKATMRNHATAATAAARTTQATTTSGEQTATTSRKEKSISVMSDPELRREGLEQQAQEALKADALIVAALMGNSIAKFNRARNKRNTTQFSAPISLVNSPTLNNNNNNNNNNATSSNTSMNNFFYFSSKSVKVIFPIDVSNETSFQILS